MPLLEKAHALVVGIAHYEYVNALPQTVLMDAQDIAALLVDPGYCGYLTDHVQVLLDAQSTKDAIQQALAGLARRTDQDSNVFIYMSCHGGRIEGGSQSEAYLLPVDAVYTADQLAATAISGSEFTTALQALPARKVTVLFDCCYAGGIGQPKDAATPVLKSGLPNSYYDALRGGKGRVILASSRADEFSYVVPGATNSLFTHYLLAGLRGDIDSDDGLIRILDVFKYLQPRVTADYHNQHPVLQAALEDNFPIALRVGGQKAPAPKVDDIFSYHAYVSFLDEGDDATWVRKTLLPRLAAAGVRVASSEDVEDSRVARVINLQEGVRTARTMLVVLSNTYLADKWSTFQNAMAQDQGVRKGEWSVLPVRYKSIDENLVPPRISFLQGIDFSDASHTESAFARLARALKSPPPPFGAGS
jgi:hypothetical protein